MSRVANTQTIVKAIFKLILDYLTRFKQKSIENEHTSVHQAKPQYVHASSSPLAHLPMMNCVVFSVLEKHYNQDLSFSLTKKEKKIKFLN